MKMKITTTAKTNLCVLITAAGSSTRMGGNTKKEYLALETGTVLSTAVKKFLEYANPKLIVITTPEGQEQEAEKNVLCDKKVLDFLNSHSETKIFFTKGGSSRQASVYNGLKLIQKEILSSNEDFLVAVHDGARPFISDALVQRTISAAALSGAAFPGLEPTETQKQIDDEGTVVSHLKRKNLISVQTPQIFSFSKLLEAHKKASGDSYEYTDDTEIWGRYCGPVTSVKGEPENIKITYPDDYKKQENRMLHTGLGYDMHRLIPGRKLFLGGVEIPFDKGEDGHSDGDVLLHAVTDALLGASGLGDIGSFFPPEEPEWKNADSKILLKTVWNEIREKGWKLENLDCVIKIEKPKFLPYREEVIKSISEILEVSCDSVFVKAKTYEKTGNWENQAEAFATCLLSK